MAKKVGELIKEARTAAKLTQAQLAEQVTGLVAADISKAERGEKELTQAQLKQIAKATGVTQASLLEAAEGKTAAAAKKPAATTAKKPAATAAKKPASAAAKKPASTAAKKPAATAAKKPASAAAKSSMQVTATEKKLVELYRKADADKKKEVMKLLKGTSDEASEVLTSLLSSVMSSLGKRSIPGEEETEGEE